MNNYKLKSEFEIGDAVYCLANDLPGYITKSFVKDDEIYFQLVHGAGTTFISNSNT